MERRMDKRLFISIPLPTVWLDLFERYKKEYFNEPIRWIEKENLHLTVHFMGDTPEEKIPEINKKLRGISAEISPFSIEFFKIDFAPPGKSKRMIWAYFLPSKSFENLVQKIEKEEREPLPHATLARFRDYRPLRSLRLKQPTVTDKIFQVTSFDLQSSQLSRSGAEYEVIESFPLKGVS